MVVVVVGVITGVTIASEGKETDATVVCCVMPREEETDPPDAPPPPPPEPMVWTVADEVVCILNPEPVDPVGVDEWPL